MPKKIIITAGPTIEPLDPIRYLTNHSTGMMGYEIAKECVRRGFEVCLISGPVRLPLPGGVEIIDVTTAREMKDKVMERLEDADCLIMAAAVCDFRPEKEEKQKIKKKENLNVKLVKNPDILAELAKKKDLVKVGFALETENPVESAKTKLKNKKLNMIVVNIKSETEDPFGRGKKQFMIIDSSGNVKKFKNLEKARMASNIISEVQQLLQ